MPLPSLALAALIASAPESSPPPSPPPAGPEARLAQIDQHRVELHLGGRAYGRFLDAPTAYGGGMQLGLGVRVVRGLHIVGEAGVGAHAMPVGVAGSLFLGLHHELRMSKWVRPGFTLGYSHLFDTSFHANADLDCGCGKSATGGFVVNADAGASLASRSGISGGLGLRFPFRWAPRLSVYLRGDVGYYFDALPGRLQAGGSLGLQVVF